MADDILTYVIVVGAAIVAPIALSRSVARANWPVVALALIAWPIFLYRLLNGRWSINQEAVAWTVGFALYSSWLAVPILAMLLTAVTKTLATLRDADKKHRDP